MFPRKLSDGKDKLMLIILNTKRKHACIAPCNRNYVFETHRLVISVPSCSPFPFHTDYCGCVFHCFHIIHAISTHISPAGRSSSEHTLHTHPSWLFLWRHCAPQICRRAQQGVTVLSLLALHHLKQQQNSVMTRQTNLTFPQS